MKSPAVLSNLITCLKNWVGQSSSRDARNRRQSDNQPVLWQDVVNTLAPEKSDASSRHRAAFDDRLIPRTGKNSADEQRKRQGHLRIIKGKVTPAALALLFKLSLEQAIAIIQALPDTVPNIANLEVQRRAFDLIHEHLMQQPPASSDMVSLVTLLASRLSHLDDVAQQALVMDLIAQYSQSVLQIDLIEIVTLQLCRLSPVMQQRTFDMIEVFLRTTADLALTHGDILLALTKAVVSDSCRQRAGALITEGLKNLRDEPELCAHIRRQLSLSYCAVEQDLQLQAV